MFGQMGATFSRTEVSSRRDGDFFSVARTIPLVADCQLGSHVEVVVEVQGQVETETCARGVKREKEVSLPLIPNDVVPPATAAKACSICTSFPEGEKVVREKLLGQLAAHDSARASLRVCTS